MAFILICNTDMISYITLCVLNVLLYQIRKCSIQNVQAHVIHQYNKFPISKLQLYKSVCSKDIIPSLNCATVVTSSEKKSEDNLTGLSKARLFSGNQSKASWGHMIIHYLNYINSRHAMLLQVCSSISQYKALGNTLHSHL